MYYRHYKCQCQITRKNLANVLVQKEMLTKVESCHISGIRLRLSRILKFIPDLVEFLCLSFIFVYEILESLIQRRKERQCSHSINFPVENQFRILKANYQQLSCFLLFFVAANQPSIRTNILCLRTKNCNWQLDSEKLWKSISESIWNESSADFFICFWNVTD